MTTNIPDRNQVRSAVEVYVDSLHQTLFLTWDLTQEERKAEAIEFVTDLVLAIEKQRQEMFSDLVLAFAQGAAEAPQTPAEARADEFGYKPALRLGPGVEAIENEQADREAAISRHPSSQARFVGRFDRDGAVKPMLSRVPSSSSSNVVPFDRSHKGAGSPFRVDL